MSKPMKPRVSEQVVCDECECRYADLFDDYYRQNLCTPCALVRVTQALYDAKEEKLDLTVKK